MIIVTAVTIDKQTQTEPVIPIRSRQGDVVHASTAALRAAKGRSVPVPSWTYEGNRNANTAAQSAKLHPKLVEGYSPPVQRHSGTAASLAVKADAEQGAAFAAHAALKCIPLCGAGIECSGGEGVWWGN
jgi:hypothetical protein